MEANKISETKYERIRKIGIGSYGVVFKCVNRQTGQIVAIKRYSENDSDPIIRKIAMREVRMLRQLKHPNLIQLIEVFRRRRILHLVFDYCELTVLDVIEKYANNCPLNLIRKIIWQLVNGVSHCHLHNCIHRDIKPENILINQAGVVKLCDFGFARNLNAPSSMSSSKQVAAMSQTDPSLGAALAQRHASKAAAQGDSQAPDNKENHELHSDRQALTEYVATRWYRAPELLVGDIYYDIKIDIWAIGCVTAELMRGEPLWPGKTDLDQLLLIKNSLGSLTPQQTHNLLTRGLYEQSKAERVLGQAAVLDPLNWKLPARVGQAGMDFALTCLQMDPAKRPASDELLQHQYIHSTLMGQFVRAATSGATTQAACSGEPDGHASGPKAAGQAVVAGRPAVVMKTPLPAGQSAVAHRSNSQAILRAANSQQPASKRMVVGQDTVGANTGGETGGSSSCEPAAPGDKFAGNSLIVKPVRARQSQAADSRVDADSRQTRHKRKTPQPQAAHQTTPPKPATKSRSVRALEQEVSETRYPPRHHPPSGERRSRLPLATSAHRSKPVSTPASESGALSRSHISASQTSLQPGRRLSSGGAEAQALRQQARHFGSRHFSEAGASIGLLRRERMHPANQFGSHDKRSKGVGENSASTKSTVSTGSSNSFSSRPSKGSFLPSVV